MLHHVYFHIPFCHRICPYCGFFKHQPGKVGYASFVEAILSEIRCMTETHPVVPRTLYFGGGTPSMLPAKFWRHLGTQIATLLDLSQLNEWTIEANPRTFDLAKAQVWKEIGITRISLGVQSFDQEGLKLLGRDHSAQDAKEAFSFVRDARIPQVNLDLMFAVPGQSLESWNDTLRTALSLQPDHISAYNLTYEEDTEFLTRHESGEWPQVSDHDAEFFLLADEIITSSGYDHYEVSNYARPGFRSHHNQAYWFGKDYLGIGPSAVSTLGRERWKNICDTDAYIRMIREFGHARGEAESLTPEQRNMEALALSLRTEKGIKLIQVSSEAQNNLIDEGLAARKGDSLQLTVEGMIVADEIANWLS